ncbi:MAG: DEAD/DEAH box helicase [Proteobacteria bacterium]|nr:DEAD/DEAH box helicase [Pseudomonadota bacterium]
MKALLAAIEHECTPAVWKRAHSVSRSGSLSGRTTHNDELELRVSTRAGMMSPVVVLSPKHQDWSCECPSLEPVCVHVAAAAMALAKALTEGKDPTAWTAPAAKMAYRLERKGRALLLKRLVARGERLKPLVTRLTTARRQDRGDAVATCQADFEVELAMSGALAATVPRPSMQRTLAALAQCSDVLLDDRPLRICEPQPVLRVAVDDCQAGFLVKAEQDPAITEIFDNGAVLRGDELAAISEAEVSRSDIEQLRAGRQFAHDQVADLVGRVLPALKERVPVVVRSSVLPKAKAMPPRIVLNAEFEDGALSVLPTLVYGDPPSARLDAGRLHYLGGPLPLRDEVQEERLAGSLARDLDLQLGKTLRLSGYQAVQFGERLRNWQDGEISGRGLESCRVGAKLEPRLDASGQGFDLSFVSEEHGISRAASPEAVVRAWLAQEPLVPLLDGGWAPLPADWLARYGHLVADLLAARDTQGELPRAAFADCLELCEALEHPAPPDFAGLASLLEGFSSLPGAILPDDLTANLREYQRRGVDWLAFLSRAELGAMLADDMGLGKTLQALCVVRRPTLVVCPASVIHNWAKEARRFRPSLTLNTYHGPNRELDGERDLTFTTYALLRLDSEQLKTVQWDTVVLDEAQYIKNPDSQVARAAFELPSRFRITLSGTPVENRLEELWSQFHFINRGLLGGRQHFQDTYVRPILAGAAQATSRLQARIAPFFMRRLKREVARELPPRTDLVLRCSLSDRERSLYDAVSATTRAQVLEQLQAGGNVMAALEALLRLRQSACHSALLPGQQATSSAKMDLLMETLEAALGGGHKALVFSQWTSLLDLVEPQLHAVRMGFCRLDGSTRDRAAVIDQFQADAGPPLLLASLKAGGTGLNLTAADHVFLLDPWWNPAAEDQAADRAHRIGQTKPVFVHRLIAQDTVEERMLELQDRKRALAAAATGGAQAASGLTREDLLSLLDGP